MSKKVIKSPKEWLEVLTPDQFRILRQAGTERPFTGEYLNHKSAGTYVCAGCGSPLFTSDSKFDSGCGWPSFDLSLGDDQVTTRSDRSHGMIRTEILCARCDGHLGHVFNDGPTSTGLRYCVNSLSLGFEPEGSD